MLENQLYDRYEVRSGRTNSDRVLVLGMLAIDKMDDNYQQQSAMILAVPMAVSLLTFCTLSFGRVCRTSSVCLGSIPTFFFTVLTTNLIVSLCVRYVHTQSEVTILLDLDIETPLSS